MMTNISQGERRDNDYGNCYDNGEHNNVDRFKGVRD